MEVTRTEVFLSFDVHVADFVTIGLLIALEALLSADNALVMAVMVLGLPAHERRQALSYGLVGALAFRSVATLLAISLIQLDWVKLFGGLYLGYLAAAHFTRGGEVARRRAPARPQRGFGLPVFWATVLRLEVTNLAFSVDSILVAVGISPKLWVVLAGGILGILAMRVVVAQLLGLIQRYPVLIDAAFASIGWISVKLIVGYANARTWITWDVSSAVSLDVVLAIFGGAYIYARARGPKPVG